MTFKKRIQIAVIATSLMLTQTGCIVGLVTGNAPLMWGGLLVSMSFHGKIGSIGWLLDSKNPSRMTALNGDIAQLGYSAEQEEQFRADLNQLHSINYRVEKTMNWLVENQNKLDRNLVEKEMNALLTDLGLDTKSPVSKESIAKVADHYEIAPGSLEIYLKERFKGWEKLIKKN
jgi:hypothetical protein